MSLERLAKLSALTKRYVSKIEHSQRAPPFSTLTQIATALDADVSLLMAENSEVLEDLNLCIVKKNERREVVSRGTLSLLFLRLAYHFNE
jgi:transcriptional regulator with XRE-family HTH domain